MIALIQRVLKASVTVDEQCVGAIGRGILALVAIEREDTLEEAEKLAEKILGFRIFSDSEGKMNLNLQQVEGGLLLVSQFTLAADTRKGLRPSFTPAAEPQNAERLFENLYKTLTQKHPKIAKGQFGADMQVALINDGPVTFHLRIPPPKSDH